MALKIVSSQTGTQLKRKAAEQDLTDPLRRLAANLIRITRGAGKSDELVDQMTRCLEAFESYRAHHDGASPKPRVVRRMLNPEEAMFDLQPWTRIDDEEINETLNRSGMAERQEAETTMRRGGLQLTAPMLLGQHTQQIAGEHEMYAGSHLLQDALAVSRLYWRKEMARRKAEEPDEAEDGAT